MPLIPETWLDSQIVNTTLTGVPDLSNIAQLANGNLLVTWTSDHVTGDGAPAGTEVFAQLFDPLGTQIGTEFRINQASTVDNEGDSDIVALPDGGFLVIYHDRDFNDLGGSNIRLERFDATGAPVAENSVVVSDSGSATFPNFANPRGAASSATSVMVVYDKIEAGISGVFFKIYNPTTDTYGAETALLTGGTTQNGDVAVLTNGNYVAVAERTDGDDLLTYRIMNSAGANVLGATFVIGTNTNAESDFEPSVTALTGGGFAIVWTNTDLVDSDIVYRIYDAAGVQTGSGLITNGSATNNNNEPVVTGLADGSFIIAYDNDEANVGTVAHIAASGVQLGELQFTGSVTQLAITSLADGRFAVTYQDLGDIHMEILDTRDNANSGVYTPNSQSIGTVGDDVFTANADQNFGYDGNDTINDGGGLNSIYGGDGDDTITIFSVDPLEVADGGSGTNLLIGSSMSNGTIYNLALGTVANGLAIQQTLNFQNVVGSNADESFVGTVGNNILSGGGGDDSINGAAGIDTMVGGAGNDTFFVNTLADLVDEDIGGGILDRVISSGNYILQAGVEIERLSANDPNAVVAMNLFGNELSQLISGNNGVNVLSGGAAGGTDTLRGFDGDDVYRVFNTTDLIIETAGGGTGDRVVSAVSFVLAADDDIEFLNTANGAGIGALNLTGNALSQLIIGNNGANILSAGATGSADTMQGLGGADIYRVFNSGDIIVEGVGGGIDRVAAAVDFALAADDNIETLATNGVAGVTAIDLRGNALSQAIEGNNGANILNGLGGSDTLTGFAGADTFAFNSALGATNIDVVADYNVAADNILLENAVFIGLAAGVLAATAFSSSLTGLALDASDRIMYETDTGFLWFDQDGNAGGFARVQFADLASGLAMAAGEFTIV